MNLFNDAVVFSYTRAQAIADGVLFDIDAVAPGEREQAGIRFPVAISKRVYEDTVALHRNAENAGCDLTGRAWDLLWMLRQALKQSPKGAARLAFTMLAVLPDRHGDSHVTLAAEVGPGDNMEPVLTVMYQDED